MTTVERSRDLSSASSELVHDAVSVAKKARRVSRQLDALEARRREIVALLIEAGLEQQDVARLLDISRQRVSQMVAKLRSDGRLPPAPADRPDVD